MQCNLLWHLFEKFSTFIINLIVYMAVFKYDLVVFQFYDFIKRNTTFTQTIYSFSLLCRLALGLVTLMASQAALSTWLRVSWRRQCEQSQHQQHFKFLDAVDEELPEATGQHVLCLLVSPITNVGHQYLAPESSVCLIVHFIGFLPIPFNFDIISYKLISF